jgi:hypothetical protein
MNLVRLVMCLRIRVRSRRLASAKPVHAARHERDGLGAVNKRMLAKHAKAVSAVLLAATLPLAGLAVVPVRNTHAL